MKELNLPFRLGMDYEELEFDLEVLPDRKGYDSYLYIGEFNKFLNYNTDKTELIFSWDMLKGIIVSITLTDISHLEVFNKYFIDLLGHFKSITVNNCSIYKFGMSKEQLWSCIINDKVYIIIADSRVILSLFYSLLW